MKEPGNQLTKENLNEHYKRKTIDLSENAIRVLERRYLKRDEEGMLLETPKDMFIRVAHNIATAEKKYVKTTEEVLEAEKIFFDMMSDLEFLPNSPTLMNAGKELQQLAACFVLPVGDSMEKIFEALKETALIQKSGGGVGYSFSRIRPRNDVVLSTKGVSSGPISFMTVFNAATDTIKQGGTRRGANMGILRVDHPDILDFIEAKEDNEKLTNFNISVGVTETFMKAVENDDKYEIINPRTKEVVDKYNAREVFKKIIKHAWKNGDPGIIFLDRLNKDNPTPNVGTIESTNPCVSGDSLISTDKGLLKASELHSMIQKGKDIRLVFDKRALDQKLTKKIGDPDLGFLSSEKISSWDRGIKEVFTLKTCSGYELTATGDHKVLTIKGYKEIKSLTKDDYVLIQPYGVFDTENISPVDSKIDRLSGLWGPGIISNMLERKYLPPEDPGYIDNGGDPKPENYFRPLIDKSISKIRPGDRTLVAEQKSKRLTSLEADRFPENRLFNEFIDRVESIEIAGQEQVFDFNEPISNSFIANGIVVRNCGEQPLLPYEACNLGSINLAKMIKEEDGICRVDYDKLKNTVHKAVRFLDDVIDMSKYPLDKITEMVQKNRKIGLGIMGWADMLVRLGIPYNSEEAIELAKEVMGFIQDESKEASRELAKARGSFPNIKGSIYDSPDGYSIRNATTTTIAPTGTLSIIANCSSGIEPIFALSFVKNVMDNDKLVEVNPYFEEIAKKEGFYSKELMEEIAEQGSLKDLEGIPQIYKKVFVTAHEVTPVWHTRMQAAFQEFVDNAVSKTVNFPNTATEQDVEEVYMLAYRLGCKGVTIYRDGSRDGQVLQVQKKKEKEAKQASKTIPETKTRTKQDQAAGTKVIQTIKPRPRPEITHGVTKKYDIGGCGKLYVTVNSDDYGICEIFTNTGEEGCAALSEAVSRLISITIRSGIELESIQKQVRGIRCITCIADSNTHVLSCPDAIGKAIEYYIKGSNKFDMDIASGPKSVMICPEEGCGGIMEPEGGCYVCRNCGFSKCS